MKNLRKISNEPFFVMPLCPSRKHHTPPVQARIAANSNATRVDKWVLGQYEYTCPDCGNITLFCVAELEPGKIYREFPSAISGGVSHGLGASAREIKKAKSDALIFLRRLARR